MKILAIETSCDETALAILDAKGGLKKPTFKILKSIVSSQIAVHRPWGGVVPNLAKREHIKNLPVVFKELAGNKDIKPDLLTVTVGPGLEPALWTGIGFAKELKKNIFKKTPLIGVNHLEGHLYSVLIENKLALSKIFPAIALIVSGGHTILLKVESLTKWKKMGETRDDAVGEAFDKVAKILSLGYPGGPVIENRAALSKNKSGVKFPKTYLGKDSLDFSFSGIKTAVLYYVRKRESMVHGPSSMDKQTINDICYSFQENVLDTLVEKTFLAASMHGIKNIVVGGGVAANSRLREKFAGASKFSEGVKIYFPEKKYCMDNAAMVGVLGEELYKRGHRSDLYLSAEPNLEVVNA